MGTLNGLEGVKKANMECEFFLSHTKIKAILDKGIAATSAGDDGAINIWRDDEGFIRCESMRYMSTLDKQKYKKISDVKTWAKEWLVRIN